MVLLARLAIRALCILLAVAACSPGPKQESADGLAGDYRRPHRVFVFHGNEPVEVEVADRLTLAAAGLDTLRLSLLLFAPSGEECRVEGVATRRGGHYLYAESTAPEACVLRVESSPRQIIVTDVESRCAAAYCGTAGLIGSVAFSRRETGPP